MKKRRKSFCPKILCQKFFCQKLLKLMEGDKGSPCVVPLSRSGKTVEIGEFTKANREPQRQPRRAIEVQVGIMD